MLSISSSIRALSVVVSLAVLGIGHDARAGSKQRIDDLRKKGPKLVDSVHGLEQDLAEYRARGLGTVPAPEFQAYLDSIVDRLLEASAVSKPIVRTHLVTDIGFGASVTADGNIFIDMRLLRALENEAALAGVLAHEVSHILLGHANKKKMQQRQDQLLQLSTAAINANRSVSRSYGVGVEVTEEHTGRKYQDIAYRLNRDILTPGWGRKQELRADELGADLLAAAGYDPAALLDYLGLLADQAAASEGMIDAVLEARSELIGDSLDAFVPDTPTTGNQLGDFFVKSARDQAEKRLAKQLAQIGKTHPDPQQRVDSFMEYTSKAAFDDAPDALYAERLQAALASPGTRVLFDHYAAALDLQVELGGEDTVAMEKLARRAVASPTNGHPFPRLVFYQLRSSQGQAGKAQKNLELAARGPEPSGRIARELAGIYIEQGKYNEAWQLVEAAWRKLGEAEALYPLVIETGLYASKFAEAEAVAQKCGTTTVLGAECKRKYEYVMQVRNQVTPGVAAAPPGTSLPDQPVSNPAEDPAQKTLDEAVGTFTKGLFGFGNKK